MNGDRWQRIDALYQEALSLPAGERPAFLAHACQGDPTLRHEIESLLTVQARADGFLEQPALVSAARTFADALPALRPPEIPGYRIIRELGEGGMGLVYLARQERTLHRLVALKLIRPGMDSRQVVTRFNAERQVLALMDHPNIAAVYDAGSTPDGLPYFVMEFVDGVPLTEYFDRARPSLRARLELFTDVCAAVQHAHQKGVIHRDLKPSNVLVADQDSHAAVKVIDFGTAKAIEGSSGSAATLTMHGMVLGTIEYMSPEQAAFSRDIDTTTDVYSLGVMLYELLVGALPFERPRPGPEGYDELRRLIRESDPPKPSARLGHGRTDRDRLDRSLKGDLDWITLKALEKDRTRRYATVAALAEDIQRFLANQPVEARPPSPGYRLRKFIRRHRGGVAAASALIIVVAAGLIASTTMYLRADRAAAEATRHQTVAESARILAEQAQTAAEFAAEDADTQRRIAEEQRRLAAEETQRVVAALSESEYRNYLITIGAADAELRQEQAATARARLLTVPVARRGWEWDHLFLRADSGLFTLADTLPCPTPPVRLRNRLVAAGDPRRLWASHCNRLVRWDTVTGERAVVSWPADAALVAVSATGRRLVTSGAPGNWQVAIVDRYESRSARVLMIAKQPPLCGDFSPDGVFVAIGFPWIPSEPGLPREDEFAVWNLQSGLRVQQWRRSRGTMALTAADGYCVVRFSPDGSLLAASGATLQVLDVRSGTERFTDHGMAGVVAQPISFSPDGTRLAVGRRNGSLDIVDLTSGALATPLDASQVARPLPSGATLAHTPDGRFLLYAFSNRIIVWDLPAGRVVRIFDGHSSPVADVAIGSNGLLYSVDLQGTIRAWTIEGSIGITRLEPVSSALSRVGIARDGTSIVAMGTDGSLHVWRHGHLEPLRLKPPDPAQRESGNVAFPSSDGRFVVTSPWTEGETSLARWSLESRSRVDTFPSTLVEPGCGVLGRAQWASLSNDDRYLAYGHAGCVVVRDVLTGRTAATLNLSAAMGGHPEWSYAGSLAVRPDGVFANDVQFRPDGMLLAAATRNVKGVPHTRTVMVWNWRVNRVLKVHTRSAVSAANIRLPPFYWAVSADGRRVAMSGFVPDAVSIWDGDLTLEVSRLPASGNTFSALTADGRRIATAHSQNDPRVRVWDTETGQLLLTLTDVDSHRGAIAFTPDGRLITGLVSGGITIWETRTPPCAACPAKR